MIKLTSYEAVGAGRTAQLALCPAWTSRPRVHPSVVPPAAVVVAFPAERRAQTLTIGGGGTGGRDRHTACRRIINRSASGASGGTGHIDVDRCRRRRRCCCCWKRCYLHGRLNVQNYRNYGACLGALIQPTQRPRLSLIAPH